LYPTLKELKWQDSGSGIKQAGSHAFRRFRNTYLRNHTLTPDGVIKFWMGHSGENMSDQYDKIRQDMKFRREVVEKPVWVLKFHSKRPLLDRMDRKSNPSRLWKWLQVPDSREINGAPEGIRTPDLLVRSQWSKNAKCPIWRRLRTGNAILPSISCTQSCTQNRVVQFAIRDAVEHPSVCTDV
jgi:hypothetical protein